MGAHASRRDTRAVMDAFRRIVQALRASDRAAERLAGISGAQLFVLHTLAEAQPLTLSELAARTHTHQSSVSVVVSRLVERGLVRRVMSARDRRARELSLSLRGRQITSRAPNAAQARLVQAVEQLPAARRRSLTTALANLASAVDAVERIPPMLFEERRHRTSRRPRARRRA